MRPDGRVGRALLRVVLPVALLAIGACNSPLTFTNAVGTGGSGAPPRADGGFDIPVSGSGGNGTGGNGMGGNGMGGNGIGGNGTGGNGPIDAPVDMRVDVPVDVGPDVPRDTGVDIPRDTGVDVGPVVCTMASQCNKVPGLTCLVVSGQPGRCVECLASSDCAANASATICDTSTQRCVECLNASQCPIAPQPGEDNPKPSQCTLSHRCLSGCDDSLGNLCPQPFIQCPSGLDVCVYCMVDGDCGTGGTCLDHVCVTCLTDATCMSATPTTPLCDGIAGRCVQCRDSRDCTQAKYPGRPLCSPATLTCVAVPP